MSTTKLTASVVAKVRNFQYALPPFSDLVLVDVSTEQRRYPRENMLKASRPRQPWRSIGYADSQYVEIGNTDGMEALYLGDHNLPFCRILKRDGLTDSWISAGPNIMPEIENWSGISNAEPNSISSVLSPYPNVVDPCEVINSDGVGDGLAYSVTMATGTAQQRNATYSLWLKGKGDSVGKTVDMVMDQGASSQVYYATITLESEWQHYYFTGLFDENTKTDIRCMIGHFYDADIGTDEYYACSPQLTPDATYYVGAHHPAYLYYLDLEVYLEDKYALGNDLRHGRGRCFLRFGDSLANYNFLKLVTIATFAPPDAQDDLYIGSIVGTPDLRTFPDSRNFPLKISVAEEIRENKLDSGGVETLYAGEPKVLITLDPGTLRTTQTETVLNEIGALRPDEYMLFAETLSWPKGGNTAIYLPTRRVYIVRRTGDFSINLGMPELAETTFTFEELV